MDSVVRFDNTHIRIGGTNEPSDNDHRSTCHLLRPVHGLGAGEKAGAVRETGGDEKAVGSKSGHGDPRDRLYRGPDRVRDRDGREGAAGRVGVLGAKKGSK